MCEYALHTDHMAVGYGKQPLIRDISLQVRRGEIMTLIGPNGSGKSTILKSLIGELRLMGGQVYLGGQPMETMSERDVACRMAVVMTERIRPELMTCEDVVSTGRYPYTGRLGLLTRRDRAKVREALAQVHALALAERGFLEISDGQRQRILLARALCQEPEIIVLDEPTSFLDIRYKLELLSLLKELVGERQMAVVMSLHEIDLAQKISDYVVCVHQGAIERYGPPEEIFTSDYIAGLYHLERGSYEANFGFLELAPVMGKAEVFVIGGNGSGISLYRHLQRKGIPFAAGVLHENDLDYPVAKALATQVITEAPFEPIGEASYQQALAVMGTCDRVICCLHTFGRGNEKNRLLMEEAQRLGKLTAEW